MLAARVSLACIVTLLAPVASVNPAVTCDRQVARAAQKLAVARVRVATRACSRRPGGACFQVDRVGVASRRLDRCTATTLEPLFAGRCVSGDPSCAPPVVASAAHAAQCLSCAVAAAVDCLTATAFTPANVPPRCRP